MVLTKGGPVLGKVLDAVNDGSCEGDIAVACAVEDCDSVTNLLDASPEGWMTSVGRFEGCLAAVSVNRAAEGRLDHARNRVSGRFAVNDHAVIRLEKHLKKAAVRVGVFRRDAGLELRVAPQARGQGLDLLKNTVHLGFTSPVNVSLAIRVFFNDSML